MNFVKVTMKDTGVQQVINLDHVIMMQQLPVQTAGGGAALTMRGMPFQLVVNETPDQIMQAVRASTQH